MKYLKKIINHQKFYIVESINKDSK